MDFLATYGITIITVLINCGVLGGALKFAYNKFNRYIERAEARDDATRSLCRAEIISICHKAQKEGYIAYYNLENLKLLYASYKALGGNGTAEIIYSKTIKLPQVEEG